MSGRTLTATSIRLALLLLFPAICIKRIPRQDWRALVVAHAYVRKGPTLCLLLLVSPEREREREIGKDRYIRRRLVHTYVSGLEKLIFSLAYNFQKITAPGSRCIVYYVSLILLCLVIRGVPCRSLQTACFGLFILPTHSSLPTGRGHSTFLSWSPELALHYYYGQD